MIMYLLNYISIMKPTWCTFHSAYWESRASTCFEHYLFTLRKRCSRKGIWYVYCVRVCMVAVSLQSWHSQLTYARNIPNAFCGAHPEDERVVLETCRGSWFSISWMKSASRWFHYTDLLWCTVSKILFAYLCTVHFNESDYYISVVW
jgi:hypothetical protein